MMGQFEILKFLEKKPGKWYKSSEISKGTMTSISSVRKALNKLTKNNDIQRKKVQYVTSGRPPYLYKILIDE